MFIDALLLFDPAATNITVTAPSTNVLDMLNPRDMGAGDHEIDILVVVQTAFLAAGAATLTTSIQTAPDNGAGAPGAFTDQILTPAIGKAALVIGAEVLRTPIPYQQTAVVATMPRFLRLNYTVATGPFTAGAVEAALVPHRGRQMNLAYPSNYVVA